MRGIPLALALAAGGFAAAGHILTSAHPAATKQKPPILIAQDAKPPLQPDAHTRTADDLFREFAAEWVRSNPDLARHEALSRLLTISMAE
jgi:hypothetical protein